MNFNLRLTYAVNINEYIYHSIDYKVIGCMFIRLHAIMLCTYWKGVDGKHVLQ
jgi:hypothetical protein